MVISARHIPFSQQRRSLLIGLMALALGGCRSGTYPLTVHLLDGAVPASLLKEFGRQQPQAIQFKSESQLLDLFRYLQAAADQKSPQLNTSSSTLISLGDAWLTAAIQEKLIQPLPLDRLPGWSRLPKAWQQLVTRNAAGDVDGSGQIWGAPYRTGSLVMAYRRDELAARGGPPTDWQDLWRDDLAGRISMLDSARVAIGATLKALGRDPNTPDLSAVTALEDKLINLHQHVRLYSSSAYLQPLILEDVWMAVGWSTDILPLVRRNQRLAVAVPQSGTLTTSDLWVQPGTAADGDRSDLGELPALIEEWIDFFWQPDIAARFSLLGAGVSPVLFEQARSSLPTALRTDDVLLPSRELIDRSSAILPLSSSVAEAYQQLWRTTRRSVGADQQDGDSRA